MLTGPHDLHVLARIASDRILNSLLAGIAIAMLAWAVARLCDRRGAGTRFAVWFSALVAIASLPWVSRLGANYSHSATGTSGSAMTLPASFASYLFIAWMVGAVLGLLRVGFSLYRLRQLRGTCAPVDLSQRNAALSASLAEIQTHRRVKLCSSEAVRVPAAIGYFRPIVVFPAWALREIPAAELDAILLHELAHLRRWDDWTNLAQKIVKALFFFHPAVWFVESRLSLEREMACDDAVLAASFSPRDYAESLISLAEKSFLRHGVEGAGRSQPRAAAENAPRRDLAQESRGKWPSVETRCRRNGGCRIRWRVQRFKRTAPVRIRHRRIAGSVSYRQRNRRPAADKCSASTREP